MSSLLERLVSPLARAQSVRTWPPSEDLRLHWEDRLDHLRRYKNNREERLAYAPEFSRTSYGRTIYTPLAVAREVCNFSAEMLFSAEPEITFEDDEALLEDLLDANGLSSALVDMAAKVAAQGRGGFRIFYNERVNGMDCPLIDYVHEHEVIWDEVGRFVVGGAVIIERQFRQSGGATSSDVYRLVEEHERGGVKRALYKGTSYQIGSPVSLDTLDEFAGLPEEEETGLDQPTLVRWDNVAGGYSDLQGLEAALDRIDTEASYGAEKSQKSRPLSFAPAELFAEDGRFDFPGIVPVRESRYTQMGDDSGLVKRFGTVQPDFTASELIAWIDFLLDVGVFTAGGYSKASYGRDDGGGNESGTAIKRRQWRTQIKASGKSRMATEALKNALAIGMAWEDNPNATGADVAVAEYRPEIKLGDPFPRDGLEVATEMQTWDAMGAVSEEETVRARRPDWDEEKIDEEVAKIKGAQETQAPRSSLQNTQALIEEAVNGNGGSGNSATPQGTSSDS